MRIDKIREDLKLYGKIEWINSIINRTDEDFTRKITIFTKRDEFGQKITKLESDILEINRAIERNQSHIK